MNLMHRNDIFVCTLLRGTNAVGTLKPFVEKAELVQDVHHLNGTTCSCTRLQAEMHRHAHCNIPGPVPTMTLTQILCTATISDLPILLPQSVQCFQESLNSRRSIAHTAFADMGLD